MRVPSQHVLHVDQRLVTSPLPGLCQPILVFHNAPAAMFLAAEYHSVRRSGPCLDFETGNPRYPNIAAPWTFFCLSPHLFRGPCEVGNWSTQPISHPFR